MNKQGLVGALEQYWTVDPTPRLNRRNTFFDDLFLNTNALKVGIVASTIATTIIIVWSLMGVIL